MPPRVHCCFSTSRESDASREACLVTYGLPLATHAHHGTHQELLHHLWCWRIDRHSLLRLISLMLCSRLCISSSYSVRMSSTYACCVARWILIRLLMLLTWWLVLLSEQRKLASAAPLCMTLQSYANVSSRDTAASHLTVWEALSRPRLDRKPGRMSD